MTIKLEHANLCVRDIDEMVRFLQAAFPEFKIRHDETDNDGNRWVHIGTDDTYLALNQATKEPEVPWSPYEGLPGVNHLAYEVNDADAVRKRLKSAGYTDNTVENKHPYRKRVYFYDPEGNDWEFVQYLSTDPKLRNDYDLPDK